MVQFNSIRVLFYLVWLVNQRDVYNAFIHGPLDDICFWRNLKDMFLKVILLRYAKFVKPYVDSNIEYVPSL